jgi:hypothetical protein
MVIATFTSGNYTQIGISKLGIKKFRTIESKLLFNDPNKFKNRFSELLDNLFGINIEKKPKCKLIFAVSGIIDEENKEVIESECLNNISYSKHFNGLSFTKIFDGIIDSDRISLINTSNCVAFGQLLKNKRKINFPTLSVYIHDSVEVSIIQDNGIINYDNVIRPIKKLQNKTANHLLCQQGIDDILFENKSNITKKYSSNFISVLKDIITNGKKDRFVFKTIFIHSNNNVLVDKKLVEDHFPDIIIYFTDTNGKNALLPIKGTMKSKRADRINLLIQAAIYISISSIFTKTYFNKSDLNDVLLSDIFLNFGSYFISFLNVAFWLSLIVLAVFILSTKGFFPAFLYSTTSGNKEDESTKRKIKEVSYFSASGSKKQTFADFSNFVEHWGKTKPVAANTNYYTIYYSDITKLRIFLADLNSITDLQKYKHWIVDNKKEDSREDD